MIQELKDELALQQIKEFLEKMKTLGFNSNETIAMMQTAIKEMK